MLLDGSERDDSTEWFSCSLRSSWDGRDGIVVVVCESIVELSLVRRVDDLPLSGLAVENVLASLECIGSSDWELKSETVREGFVACCDWLDGNVSSGRYRTGSRTVRSLPFSWYAI